MRKFPSWLRQPARVNENAQEVKNVLSELGIDTVCQSARCPNIYDCFSRKRCTFFILGDSCTRHCRFCAVPKSEGNLEIPEKSELFRVRDAVKKLGIKDVVITSVTRDDLPDGGAGHFAECIYILRAYDQNLYIEVLVPDFLGDKTAIEKVVLAVPDVCAHNIETVHRLYSLVRPGADYKRSLHVLECVKDIDNNIMTKSGIMVGLGEREEEIYEAMQDLRRVGCDIITIGQYLKPDTTCLEVEEFVHPEKFEKFSGWAKDLGFKKYACGPFVRSSYVA